MTDEQFAAELTRLEAQGEAGKQAMWKHIKENGGMKRVAALVQAGAGKRPKKSLGKFVAETTNLAVFGAVLIDIPLVDGSDFGVTEHIAREFALAYPAVDVGQELRAMRAWCLSNKAQRKTRTGIMRFLNSWLAKEQNRGGPGGRMNGRGGRAPSAHDNLLAGAAMFLQDEERG